MIREIASKLQSDYLKYKRSKFFPKIKTIIEGNTSIISNNCFAGRIYQDFNLEYNSPTAGLYMFYPDYIDFLTNLSDNLMSDLRFVQESKYDIGNTRIRNAKHKYPVALLNGSIEIHFLHYPSPEEAAAKWSRRAERVNLSNLLIIGGELDRCTPEDVRKFDELNFQRKIFFSANYYPYESCCHLKQFQNRGTIGDPYKFGDMFYEGLCSKHF